MFRLIRMSRGLFLCVLITLCGCKEVLYSNLAEHEANEMVAVLQAFEVASARDKDADGMYSILVETAQIGISVLLLQQEGLPRKKFSDLGEIFSDSGIVGTPFEERARFMYALNQELGGTISAIDGVREARVHIVLPEAARFDRAGKVASAAVAIYYNETFDAQTIVPTIKTMMAHSVPELIYDNVSVSLFPVGGARPQISAAPSLIGAAEASPMDPNSMSIQIGTEDTKSLIMAALFLILAAVIIWSIHAALTHKNGKSIARGKRCNHSTELKMERPRYER